MNKNTTPRKLDDLLDFEQDQKVVEPSVRTLDFLKSFARTYYVEKKLPEPMNSICLN